MVKIGRIKSSVLLLAALIIMAAPIGAQDNESATMRKVINDFRLDKLDGQYFVFEQAEVQKIDNNSYYLKLTSSNKEELLVGLNHCSAVRVFETFREHRPFFYRGDINPDWNPPLSFCFVFSSGLEYTILAELLSPKFSEESLP